MWRRSPRLVTAGISKHSFPATLNTQHSAFTLQKTPKEVYERIIPEMFNAITTFIFQCVLQLNVQNMWSNHANTIMISIKSYNRKSPVMYHSAELMTKKYIIIKCTSKKLKAEIMKLLREDVCVRNPKCGRERIIQFLHILYLVYDSFPPRPPHIQIHSRFGFFGWRSYPFYTSFRCALW